MRQYKNKAEIIDKGEIIDDKINDNCRNMNVFVYLSSCIGSGGAGMTDRLSARLQTARIGFDSQSRPHEDSKYFNWKQGYSKANSQ